MSPIVPSTVRDSEISSDTVSHLSRVFRLLGCKARVRIMLHLSRVGEADVTALCALLKQTQPAVSHHLGLLRWAGLIGYRREGKHNFYSLRTDQFRDLMRSLVHEKGHEQPCEQFLECVFHKPNGRGQC